MRSVVVRVFAQAATFVAVAGLVISGLTTPVGAFENGGCRTQEIFEQKYGPREGLASFTKDPNACPQLGSCDNPAERDLFIPDSTDDIIYIHIYFNVFANSNGDSAVATVEDVQNQVDILNQDYLPYRIQFIHDMRIINNSTFRNITSQSEFDQMKSQYAVLPSQQLNVFVSWINIGGDVFSFATFPWDGDATSSTGGVCMSDQQFYPDDVHTLTHEIGHCFGLWHTFHGVQEVGLCDFCYESPDGPNNDLQGDLCADTRPTPLNFNCQEPGGTDQCSGLPWAPTPLSNYMGYGPAFCVTEFTPQQAGRMNCWIRDRLVTWAEPLFVDATPVFGVAPLSVAFDAQSPREVTEWNWAFGDGQFGFVEDPVHEYVNPGIYSTETELSSAQGPATVQLDSLVWVHADTMEIDSIDGTIALVEVNIYVRNYLPLKTITVPVTWQGPLDLDYFGAFTTGLRTSYLTPTQLNYSAALKRVALRLDIGANPAIAPGTGPVLTLRFQVNDGGQGDINPVVFTSWSSFNAEMVTTNLTTYTPTLGDGGIFFPQSCCTGPSVGNVDGSLDNEVTLGDLTVLIDHLFVTLADVDCPAEGDLDLSGSPTPEQGDITLGDLTVMIDHLFISLAPLPPCP